MLLFICYKHVAKHKTIAAASGNRSKTQNDYHDDPNGNFCEDKKV